MSEDEVRRFWRAVYVATIRLGCFNEIANDRANYAIEDLQRAFPMTEPGETNAENPHGPTLITTVSTHQDAAQGGAHREDDTLVYNDVPIVEELHPEDNS